MAEYLYIHIPFCVRKCIYCDFLSLPFETHAAQSYVESLCKELELRRDSIENLQTIYIGGGTPTLLPIDCFRQVFRCLEENYDFSSDIEISVEANPGTVNASAMEDLTSLGVNRVSIGIQSFHNNELKTLGRIHTAEEAEEAVMLVKGAGIENFSLDLMYGIPGQTMKSWKQTLSTAVGLSPAHISSYELTPEEGTPLWRLIKADTIKMPEEGLVLEMYGHAKDFLNDKGYAQYEISNFALPGSPCLHNLNYWNRGEYVGVGAGAHSFVAGVRSWNTPDIGSYRENLGNHSIPCAGAIEISAEEALKEIIFLGLRKSEGISITAAEKARQDIVESCGELISSGHLVAEHDRLKLTRKALPVSNMVIVHLFEKLGL